MMIATFDQMAARFADVKLIQRFGVEPNGVPLDDDGVIGPKTRSGLFIDPDLLTHPLTLQMARLALLNAREEGGNNRGRWPGFVMGEKPLIQLTPEQIAALGAADVLKWQGREQGPTCAGHVSTVFRLAYGPGQPWSLSAREITRLWSRGPGRVVKLADAQEGDVLAWERDDPDNKAAGHVVIVVARHAGLVITLEGNGSRKNGAVGLYGYDLASGAKRGRLKDQEVLMVARRPA